MQTSFAGLRISRPLLYTARFCDHDSYAQRGRNSVIETRFRLCEHTFRAIFALLCYPYKNAFRNTKKEEIQKKRVRERRQKN